MTILWGDTETRSRCDLKSKGAYNYSADASTQILCFSYAFDDEPVQTWAPGVPFPLRVIQHINARGQLRFHNAGFDRLILWYVLCPDIGVPEPRLEQFYCTAAQARANCLPGSLEDVGRAVSSKMKKDHRGSALIRLLSVPRKDGTFNDDPTLMAEFFAYCEQDVRAMREISKAMRPLSDDELADYHANERINDRGVLVDIDLCRAAIGYAEAELIEIQEIVREVSKGEITSVRSPKMRQWVQDRVGPEAVKLMWTGEKYSIDKTVRANLLTLSPDEVPADVAEIIQCADDLWASSVAKFKRLADLADVEDNRVRGAFVFAGGSATGRACVDANTLVETEDGRCPIWLLKRGGKVLTHTGRLCKVTDVIYKGTETMYRVTTASGAWVDCTADHQLLTHLGWEKHEHKSSGAARSGYTVGSRAVIYDPAVFTRHRNSQNNAHDGSDGVSDITGGSAKRPAKVVAFGQSSSVKDSRKKPYVWRAEASRSDIAAGLPLSMGGGASRVCAGTSVAVDDRVGYIRMADRLGSASHRFEYTEQQPKQSSYSHVEWASNTSFAEITEIVCVGEKGVWDITVDGDASYCAQGLIHHNSSYGAQVHNFTRKTARDPAAVRQAMVRGHQIVPSYGKRVTDVLKGMLRPALVPAPGKVFVVADWSSIEGRVNPWLSNCPAGEAKLNVFRLGLDPYKVNAMALFGVAYDDVSGDQRQVGKVQELALGFLGGPGSFETFGRVYGVRVENVPRAIRVWRSANPWAMKHGHDLEAAYTRALRHKGHECRAGRVCYLFDGQHLWYALPSGRVLCYPYAKLEADGVSYLKASWKPAADATEWPRARLWRGLAVENVTQAVANDILRHALRRLEDVVLHIHDEIVVECVDDRAAEVERVMCEPPDWAVGLPLAAEVKIMTRYGK